MRPQIPAIERPDSLAQQAYRLLRLAIQRQELVQDTFYSESELAEFMGISRTPVREALIELAREGLVEIIPQRGFRLHVLDSHDRREVFDLRDVLEAYVVGKLARQATPEDVGRLRELLDRQTRLVDDADAFLEVDEQFHMLMPQLVGLRLAHQMLGTLRGAMWLLGSSALALPERIPDVLEEHAAIVDAIEAGDAGAAKRAIKSHVRTTAKAAAAKAG